MTMQWLALRGLAREQRHWHEFRELFSARMGRANVHFVDVAGVGTQHAAGPWPSVRWMARDVARRLPELTAAPQGPRWSVLGLSLGGMLALELCAMFPLQIQAAVVVNASSRLTSVRDRLRPAAAAHLLRAALSGDPLRREQIILGLTSALPEVERTPRALRAAEFARDSPTRRRAALAHLIAASRFAPPARAELRARLAFICSRHDQLVSPLCTRHLAAWYGREWDEHPWAGHDLPLDDPVWLCDRIVRFVEPDEVASHDGEPHDREGLRAG